MAVKGTRREKYYPSRNTERSVNAGVPPPQKEVRSQIDSILSAEE